MKHGNMSHKGTKSGDSNYMGSKQGHMGPGSYPRRPGSGMNTGARATGGTMQHDGIANCRDCMKTKARGRMMGNKAAASIQSLTSREMGMAERPSSVGGVHGHKTRLGQPHNPAMAGYGKKKSSC